MATDHNFIVKNGLEVGGVLIVNSNGSLAPLTNHIKLNDNVQLQFGTGTDSNIRHDGSNTKFTHTGSGGLYIGANTFGIQNGAHNENYIMAAANGAVTVYYDGSLRLSTTTTGIKVEGASGNVTIGAQNTTGLHIYTDRDRFYFNKQISLIDNTLTSYNADLVLKRVGSTKLTLTSGGVSVGGTLTSSGTIAYNPAEGNDVSLGNDGTYGTSGSGRYVTLGFSGTGNGSNRIFAHNTGGDGLFLASATSRHIVFRTGGSGSDTFKMTADGRFQMGSSNTTIIDASRNLTNIGTINTGQGATEVYAMNQNVRSSDSPTFQDLTIQGNLSITGDINSYNVTDLDVVDKTITLGVGGTASANNGGGIVVDGANAKLTWGNSAARWTMNKSLQFSDTATTTNQAMGVFWPGFDKEATSDYSDNAKIIHTTNTGGHTGSVLLIESQNDANDGIAFTTNSSSPLKHNSNTIWTSGNDGASSGLNADLLDDQHGSYYRNASNINAGTLADARLGSQVFLGGNSGTITGNNSQSFDTFTDTGTHYVSNWTNGTGTTNGPSDEGNAYGWGMLRVTQFIDSNYVVQEYIPHNNDGTFIRVKWNGTWGPWRQSWTSRSDGANSGLDADKLDGQHGSYYQNASNINTGTLSNSRLPTNLGSTKTLSGANAILKLQETDVTNSPTWWHVADGGNYSIRLNNTGAYPIRIETDSDNDAVTQIGLNYTVDLNSNKLQFGTETTSYIQNQNKQGTDVWRFQTEDGYIDIGSENTSWAHLTSDRNSFYFNPKITVDGNVEPYGDSSHSLGTNTLRWANVYADTLYGDGSNITGVTGTDSTKLPLAGGTMTGTLNMGGNAFTGNNFNISGVNQISLNDPGEGIVFGSNCNLYLLDDAADNILRLDAPGGFRLHNGPLSMGTTTVIDTSRNLTNIGTISSGAISATSIGVTNIVTNKIVKFNGSILDDANITDTGSLITLGSNTAVTGKIQLNDGADIQWAGGYGSNKPLIAANANVLNFYTHGASGGVEFALTGSAVDFKNNPATNVGTISSSHVNSSGRGTFVGNAATPAGLNALNLLSSTNGGGVAITFTDNGSPPAANTGQRATLQYWHSDGASYGSGNAFVFDDTENSLSVVADGKILAQSYYMKPSSGTGAGTQIIDSSRNLTNIGTITATGSVSSGSLIRGRNTHEDDETLFAITDNDDTASIRAKFETSSSAYNKYDDADAPASGVFTVAGSVNPTWGAYIPIDDDSEIMFETWAKHISGSDNTGNFYAGAQFYNGSKTSLGNNSRYWGANGDGQDSDHTTWRHIKGVMKGSSIRSVSATSTSKYMRFLTLFNYNASGNTTAFCGFRFYRSKKTISSLYLKRHQSSPYNDSNWQSTEAGTVSQIIDNDGNIYAPGSITVAGSLAGKSDNTTEIGTYTTGAIKRIRMAQGGELHFGDTTTSSPLGITEGAWNNFGDQDRMSIYYRSSLKLFSGTSEKFAFDNSGNFTAIGNVTVNGNLYIGDGNDGYFYNDVAGRTAFRSGDFYIQDTVTNFYNYATNQYYGDSSGDNIHFRGNVLNGTGWSINGAGKFSTRDIQPEAGYVLMRSNHHSGHLEGSYNNVGDNALKSNPIYTIGSSYNPNSTTLSNMYGIGYTNASSSFIGVTGAGGWGMYVAADGDARVWLDGSNGIISSTGEHYANGSRVFHDAYHPNADTLTTARTINGVSFNGSANITVADSTKLPLGGGTMTGQLTLNGNTISMGNGAIVNANNLTFNDPGVNEGIKWNSGNEWQIYESPDAQTNSAGNLQFTTGSGNGTRRFTITTDGYIGAARTYFAVDRSTGYFYNDTSTRTAYTGGDFYIKSDVSNCYLYATNTYMGGSSGDTIRFRANTVTADSWGITSAGAISGASIRSTGSNYYGNSGSSVAYRGYGDTSILTGVNGATYLYPGGSTGVALTLQSGRTIAPILSIGQVNSYTDIVDSGRNLVNITSATFSNDVAINNGSPELYFGTTGNHYNWRIAAQENVNAALEISVGSQDTNYANDTYTTKFHITNSGTGTFAGDVVAYSDERLKTNIQTLDGKKALQMRGVSFEKDGEQSSGVIAQELEKIAPELVKTAEDEMQTKSVAYGNLVGYLIEAVKEQQEQINKLTSRLDDIEKGE